MTPFQPFVSIVPTGGGKKRNNQFELSVFFDTVTGVGVRQNGIFTLPILEEQTSKVSSNIPGNAPAMMVGIPITEKPFKGGLPYEDQLSLKNINQSRSLIVRVYFEGEVSVLLRNLGLRNIDPKRVRNPPEWPDVSGLTSSAIKKIVSGDVPNDSLKKNNILGDTIVMLPIL